LKNLPPKKPGKDEREKLILIGLVELYLKTGKPVGSQTLQEQGFETFSSATLRNYFSKLEEQGFLKQQHSSGGRIPTNLAYKMYADSLTWPLLLEEKEKKALAHSLLKETRELHSYLQKCAETISDLSQGAVFLSFPRFDQDFVLDVKMINIDTHRILCIFITDFGSIHTETLYTDKKLSSFDIKRIEQFFRWKITGLDKPNIKEAEEKRALSFYNEAMLRHIVDYSNFSSNDLMKTGFSKMLNYLDFNDASSLANGLALFENNAALQSLLMECCQKKALTYWIGEELSSFSSHAASCSVITAPYYIHQSAVGSIGILCPNRSPYKKLFALMSAASEMISSSLTQSLYKFKISYRRPNAAQLDFNRQALLLVENKPQENE
jgi:heat-inducible transcriptional repressor